LEVFRNDQLRHCQKAILDFVRKEKPDLLKEISTKKTLTPEIKEALDALPLDKLLQ